MKRRLLCLVAGVALFAVLFQVLLRGPQEPAYHGKPLTQWINEAYDIGIFEQTDETKAAMLAMSTNAVPFLLNDFNRSISSGWWSRLCDWVNRHPALKIHIRTNRERIQLAGEGLMLLGPGAAPALSTLLRYVGDPERGRFLKDILPALDDSALPYLAAELMRSSSPMF